MTVCHDHGLAHRHRLEDRRDTRLKVGIVQRHYNDSRARIQVTQRSVVKTSNLNVVRQWCTLGGVAALRPVAGRPDHYLHIESFNGIHKGWIVAELQACAANQALLRDGAWSPELRIHLIRDQR